MRRRLQLRAHVDGVSVFDDFAHHPTAIAETLAGLRSAFPGAAHLGDLRAAVGHVLPAGLPIRISRGRSRRRRGGDRRRLPVQPAGAGTAVRRTARRRSSSGRESRRATSRPSMTLSPPWPERSAGSAISSSSCRTAASEESTRSSSMRCRHRRGRPRRSAEMTDFALRPAGDAAIVVDFEARLDPAINARAVSSRDPFVQRQPAGVRDVVVGYHSVTAYVDPLCTRRGRSAHVARPGGPASRPAGSGEERTVTVPGPVRRRVGARTSASVARFRRLRRERGRSPVTPRGSTACTCSASCRASRTGRGRSRIAAPRRQAPRVAVPAGSIGIAGTADRCVSGVDPGRLEPDRPYATRHLRSRAGRALRVPPGDAVRFEPLDRWPA